MLAGPAPGSNTARSAGAAPTPSACTAGSAPMPMAHADESALMPSARAAGTALVSSACVSGSALVASACRPGLSCGLLQRLFRENASCLERRAQRRLANCSTSLPELTLSAKAITRDRMPGKGLHSQIFFGPAEWHNVRLCDTVPGRSLASTPTYRHNVPDKRSNDPRNAFTIQKMRSTNAQRRGYIGTN